MDLRSILLDHGFSSAENASTNIDLTQINQDLDNLSTYIDTTFADGIISQMEASRIQSYINALNADNTKLQQQYDSLYNNADLTDETVKANLANAMTNYSTNYELLITDINNAIADGVSTKEEANQVDTDYSNLTADVTVLTAALENARNSILGARSSATLKSATDYTDGVKKDIDTTTNQLSKDLYDADGFISTTFRSGVISDAQKTTVQSWLNTLATDKANMDNRYTQLDTNYWLTDPIAKANLESAYSTYSTTYQNLVDTINAGLAAGVGSVTEDTAVTNAFTNFETAVANLSTYMEQALNTLSQSRADNAEALAKKYSDDNLQNVTDILDNMDNDSKITQNERATVKDDITRIIGRIIGDGEQMPDLATIDQNGIGEAFNARTEALNAGIAATANEYVEIGNAYTALTTYLNAMTPYPWDVTSTLVITVDKNEWRNTWLNYFVSIAEVKASVASTLNTNKVDTSTYTTDQQKVNTKIDNVATSVTYSCYIVSSNGNVFKDGQISTTLTATVMQGPQDITSTITPSQYIWKRTSADSVGDETWNQNHVNVGNIITVTKDDVNVRATFQVQILEDVTTT